MKRHRPIEIGNRIPEFSLKDQNGKLLNISDYIGIKKLVIFFYPKDGSLTCTQQACYFRDIYDLFEEAGAEVIGISGQSVESHSSFALNNKLNYRILSDFGNYVRDLFGVPSRAMGLIPGRVTYIISRRGEVSYIFDSQTQTQRHVDEALRIVLLLKKLDHAKEGV